MTTIAKLSASLEFSNNKAAFVESSPSDKQTQQIYCWAEARCIVSLECNSEGEAMFTKSRNRRSRA
jgi:hypothetical protein